MVARDDYVGVGEAGDERGFELDFGGAAVGAHLEQHHVGGVRGAHKCADERGAQHECVYHKLSVYISSLTLR